MYNGFKTTVPAVMAATGFRFGWMVVMAATLLFLGMALKGLAKRSNGLRP
jgi:hypothetical protein